MTGNQVIIAISIICAAIIGSKVASFCIEVHYQNERLKIEREYQEDRSRQNKAFLDYLASLSKLYAENK